MVFNTTFNNSSVISRQSVLLVEESGENNLSEFTDKLYHLISSRITTRIIYGGDVCGSLYVYFNVKCLYSVYCFFGNNPIYGF
jgi:hypothetical protein